jgi:hypothetical protein
MIHIVTILISLSSIIAFRLPSNVNKHYSSKITSKWILNDASSPPQTKPQNLQALPVIEEYLAQTEPGLKKAMLGMFRACKEIAYKIRTASCDRMACFNDFGDEQLAIDILANNVIFQNLKNAGSVAIASSEENPTEGKLSKSLH